MKKIFNIVNGFTFMKKIRTLLLFILFSALVFHAFFLPISNINALPTTKQTPTPTPDPVLTDKNLGIEDFFSIFFGNPKVTPKPTGTSFWNIMPTFAAQIPQREITTPTPPVDPTISGVPSDIGNLNFSAWGLPPPIAESDKMYIEGAIVERRGIRGYEQLKNQLQNNANASWAAKELLMAERYAKANGYSDLINHFTTGWLWFETGGAKWPDPYQTNCNDPAGGESPIEQQCRTSNFQTAGYRPAEKATRFLEAYQRLYGGDEAKLKPIMDAAVANSTKASANMWRYTNTNVPSDIKLSMIARDSSTFLNSSDIQRYTLVLGRDPKMVVAMNSYAVNNSDIIRALKSSRCAYGYICEAEKQILSNMIAALYLFDGGDISTPGIPGLPGQTGKGLVYYRQCDYNNTPMAPGCSLCNAGCGITTVAMALSTKDSSMTPPKVLNMYKQQGAYVGCDGTAVGDAKKILSQHFQTSDYIFQKQSGYTLDELNAMGATKQMREHIKAGKKIFMLANFCVGRTTCLGHFFWITDIDEKTGRPSFWSFDPAYVPRGQNPPIDHTKRYPDPRYRYGFAVKI